MPPSADHATTPCPFGALRSRAFRRLWIGLVISNTGTWMQTTAQGWLIYSLTESPLTLGLLGASFAVPMITLPLVGGTLADRCERTTVLKWTQTVMLLCALGLALLAFCHRLTAAALIGITAVSAIALAADNPTRQALIPDLVAPEALLGAISLHSAAFNGAALVGPALAGLVLGWAGQDLYQGCAMVFLANAVSFIAVLIPVWLIHPYPVQCPQVPQPLHTAVLEGLRYVHQRPELRLLLILSALTSVFGRSFHQLLPVFARGILGVGPQGLGVMLALPGAGTLLAGVGVAGRGQVLTRRQWIVMAQLGFVASIIAFAMSRCFPLSLLALGLSGVSVTVFGATLATSLQLASTESLRGRVMSLYTITLIGLGPLGSLLSGALALVLPISQALSLAALALLVVLAVAVTRSAWQDVR